MPIQKNEKEPILTENGFNPNIQKEKFLGPKPTLKIFKEKPRPKLMDTDKKKKERKKGTSFSVIIMNYFYLKIKIIKIINKEN